MPEQTRLHLPQKYADTVRALLRQHLPRAEVWAYGSRVNGDCYDASDLDLVARFPTDDAAVFGRLSALRAAFQDSDLPIMVQIVDWDATPASFRQEIAAGYVVMQAPPLA